jgi:mono/diheme cytochrome c family protein
MSSNLLRSSLIALSIVASSAVGFAAETAETTAVGSRIDLAELSLTDFRGKQWTSEDFNDADFVVYAFLGVECPLAKLYTTRLIELKERFADSPIAWCGVDANVQDSLRDMAAHARRYDWELPFVKDPDQTLASLLGATRTPEVCIVSREGKLLYRGRIDDQYGIGYVREEPTQFDLKDALDALLAGEPVPNSDVAAVGCVIGRRRPVDDNSEVTYSNQIVRLLQDRCVSCHREGDIGPMAFTDYDEVAGWSEMILEVVDERRMPPWHASPEFGHFENDRRLSDEEMDLIRRWVRAGAPKGDESQLPKPPTYVQGWQADREPDMVVDVSPEPYSIPATGEVEYKYFKVDPELAEDKWIVASEFVPGNRQVVHHILAFARPKGTRGGLNGARGFLAGYVPGTRVDPLPAGIAKKLPADSELIFQVHYTPIGTETTDQSKFGLWFIDPAEVTHELSTTSAVQPRLSIPPGDDDYRVVAMLPERLPDCELVSFSPHMHLRGKSFRYSAVLPDGEREVLLDVPEYDFNWQTEYRLSTFKKMPKGSRIFCEAKFDNSDRNPNNPDPSQTVRWGDQTDDEMMIGYFHVVTALERDEDGGAKSAEISDAMPDFRKMNPSQIFDALDTNGDDRLEEGEVPAALRRVIGRLDRNKDNVLTRDEVPRP